MKINKNHAKSKLVCISYCGTKPDAGLCYTFKNALCLQSTEGSKAVRLFGCACPVLSPSV